jgi:hypothetical protein
LFEVRLMACERERDFRGTHSAAHADKRVLIWGRRVPSCAAVPIPHDCKNPLPRHGE